MTQQLDIHSLFFHSQHIDNPKWFAGRKYDIEKALKSLCSAGSSILVFGERGVGKSSFFEMVKQIAAGNTYLLFKYNWHKLYPPEKFKFKVASIVCDADCTSTAKVLQRLITSPEGLKSIVSVRKEQIETLIKGKFSFDFLNVFKAGTEEERKIQSTEFNEDSIYELFTNVILAISKNILSNSEGLLISIDEFDMVTDSEKMSSLIKNLSQNNVKFIISGIADSYEQLMKGHKSIFRQLAYGRIEIIRMTYEEVEEVFKNIEVNSNYKIKFEENFIRDVFDKSSGYPYFVQLFGQLALDNYVETRGVNPPIFIHNQHLKSGLTKLRLFELQMEKDYISIVKENSSRELLLKFIGRQKQKRIKDETILAYCHTHGVTQPEPKYLLANFLSNRDPQFLIREKEDSDFIVFTDPLFKTYINSREPDYLKHKNEEYYL